MIKKIIIIYFLNQFLIYSQSIYEPVYNTGIYNFLDNQSLKGRIQIFDEVRPYRRLYIAQNLLKLSEDALSLTSTETDQLDFYKKEYAFELKYLKKDTTLINEFFKFGVTDRFEFYKYYDKNFTFEFNPILGIGYDIKKKNYHQYSGLRIRGRISDFVGFYFDYRDNLERGDNLDRKKMFTTETGVIVSKGGKENFEYSETRGGLTFGWDWGSFTMAKDFINIGSSFQSSVILSSKAPSFPFMRLEIHPVNWLRYNFFHAWLNSGLLDSSSIRYTLVTSTFEDRSKTYSKRQKFYVSHSLSLMPLKNWCLTIGESIIYSDQLEYIYFLPVFYRLADHYNSVSGGDTGDNAQIFFNTSYWWDEIKSRFYWSVYIDEFSLESLLGNGNNAQVYALTLGGKITNPFWNDSYITLEYTAIKPYSYMNGDPAQTYFSSGYQLGHWIGSNSVQHYFLLEQYFSRAIKLQVSYQYILKGSKENITDYYNRNTSTYPLLFGIVSTYVHLGFKVIFNPLNDLYFTAEYNNVLKSNGRFINEYGVKEGDSFVTNIRYGF